jgi:hypothetical protein
MENRGQKYLNVEFGMGKSEFGIRNGEFGRRNLEYGIWTRRRPIGRDYAAAKDAEGGIRNGG